MKKLLLGFIGIFAIVYPVFAAEQTATPLRVYQFTPDVLESVSTKFFPNVNKKYPTTVVNVPQEVYCDEEGCYDIQYAEFTFGGKVNAVYGFLLTRAGVEQSALKPGECRGCLSGTDIIDGCKVGGLTNISGAFNDHLDKCIAFFEALCEAQGLDDEWSFNKVCPAPYDGDKRQTGLKSIGENTRIGDICGGNKLDSFIQFGYVTLKDYRKEKNKAFVQDRYSCTCTPYKCFDGRYYNEEKHRCEQTDPSGLCTMYILSDNKGPVLFDYRNFGGSMSQMKVKDSTKKMSEYNQAALQRISADLNAFKQCQEHKNRVQFCKINGAIAEPATADSKKYKVICNPTADMVEQHNASWENKKQKFEDDIAKLKKQEAEEQRQWNLKHMQFKKVCGDDKGKTGGTERCIDALTGWSGEGKVDLPVAKALAKEYARVKYGDEIECSNNYYTSRFDDYISCTSIKDITVYYEFQINSVTEQNPAIVQRNALELICTRIFNGTVFKQSDAVSVNDLHKWWCKIDNCSQLDKTLSAISPVGSGHAVKGNLTYSQGYKILTEPGCYMYLTPSETSSAGRRMTPDQLVNDFSSDKEDNFVLCESEHAQFVNNATLEKFLKEYMEIKYGAKGMTCQAMPGGFYGHTPCDRWKGIDVYGETKRCCDNAGRCIDFATDKIGGATNFFTAKNELSLQSLMCIIEGQRMAINVNKNIAARQVDTSCTALDDEHCAWLSEELKKMGRGGAYMHPTKHVCILSDAESLEVQATMENIAIGTVVVIGSYLYVKYNGGMALLGGSSTSAEWAAMLELIGWGAYELMANKVQDDMEARPAAKISEFLKETENCNDSKCATDYINKWYNEIMVRTDTRNQSVNQNLADLAENRLDKLMHLADWFTIVDEDEEDPVLLIGSTAYGQNSDKTLRMGLLSGNVTGPQMAAVDRKYEWILMAGVAVTALMGNETGLMKLGFWRVVFKGGLKGKNFKSALNMVRHYRRWKNSGRLSGYTFKAEDLLGVNVTEGTHVEKIMNDLLGRQGYTLKLLPKIGNEADEFIILDKRLEPFLKDESFSFAMASGETMEEAFGKTGSGYTLIEVLGLSRKGKGGEKLVFELSSKDSKKLDELIGAMRNSGFKVQTEGASKNWFEIALRDGIIKPGKAKMGYYWAYDALLGTFFVYSIDNILSWFGKGFLPPFEDWSDKSDSKSSGEVPPATPVDPCAEYQQNQDLYDCCNAGVTGVNSKKTVYPKVEDNECKCFEKGKDGQEKQLSAYKFVDGECVKPSEDG